ncbi:hypothetical protein DID88_006971 [Monilinia fructigena]|uniref:Uncharacterized protein n=1 Tax=Monilinia fructigena TaxID=38457 RepID=A0A395IFW2_9HELO|nr:hypothetical protein DID88_006971 [Monilinia fructigena]
MSPLTFLDLPGEIRNQIYYLLLIVPPISTPRPLGSDPPIYPQILIHCDPNFTAVRAEDAFNGIEELTIRVEQSAFRGSDYQVLKLFEGVRGVKKTKISGSVSGFPAYVEWLQDVMKMPKGIDIAPFEREDDEAVQNQFWILNRFLP